MMHLPESEMLDALEREYCDDEDRRNRMAETEYELRQAELRSRDAVDYWGD